jgi:F-type H+-transporting ATPase subunit b
MPTILQLDLQQIISQAVSFLILLWVLRRFAWRPLLTLLDQRRARIEEDLRRVAQAKVETERLQADYGRRLAAIEEEARTKIQQAILDGKRIAIEIQEQARAQGQALVTKAKETVELELVKAKVTLRDQVASMTVEAVERVLRKKLDERTDRALIDSVVEELDHSNGR